MNWRVLLMNLVRRGDLMNIYNQNIASQYIGDEISIQKEMDDNALNIFKFHVENNNKYREFLDSKGFDYSNLNNIDWSKIPTITKADLRKYYPEVKAEIYNYSSSGGSTNAPFRYPASIESALFTWPSHWMLHNVFGAQPYAKMVMIMGAGNVKKSRQTLVYHKLSNFITFNAFDLSTTNKQKIYNTIQSKKVEIIYGYASAINEFLLYLKENDLHLDIKGIVTTSENRIPYSQKLAEEYCNCDIYDQYGAHDGDVFGFECSIHNGLHINHRYCTLEIVNREILLTAVKNRAFPFIKYQVGDLAVGETLIKEKCECGRTFFRLQGLSGRTVYDFKDNDGHVVSAFIFDTLIKHDTKVMQYQLVEKDNTIFLNLLSDIYTQKEIDDKYLTFAKKRINKKVVICLNDIMHKLPNAKTPLYINLDKINE